MSRGEGWRGRRLLVTTVSRRAVFVLTASLVPACAPAAHPARVASAEAPPDETRASSSRAEVAQAELNRGIELIQKKDFTSAKTTLMRAEADSPDDAKAAYYLAVAEDNLNEEESAKKHYTRALELDPDLTEASVNLSALLLDGGDAAAALGVADQGLRHASKNPELLMNRALALETAGNPDDAVKAYGAAVAAAPQNREIAYAYAELLVNTGRRDQALEELHKLADADDPKLIQAVANLFGRLKAYNECVLALDSAIGKHPSVELYVRRGLCRHELDDEDGAQSDYRAALALNPSSAPAHYYLGMHYRQAGDKKQATSHLNAAVASGKGTPIAEAAERALGELRSSRK